MASKSERINLRVSPEQLAQLDAGAAATGQDRTAFILEVALLEALERIRDRTVITLDEKSWDEFVEMLEQPPRELPRLRKLFQDYPP